MPIIKRKLKTMVKMFLYITLKPLLTILLYSCLSVESKKKVNLVCQRKRSSVKVI